MTDHDFDTSIVQQTNHRPWAMPDAPWVMTQTWHDLLFAHWPVDPAPIRARLPHTFELDLFDGQAWIGVVPFRMTNVAPRGVPSMPWVSAFSELNVRTYVQVGGRPGVYFFSLDAESRFAVRAARALLNLPYWSARMKVSLRGDEVEYHSRRRSQPSTEFTATYAPAGSTFNAAAGTLEYFLTERYCLYHQDRAGAPYRLEIHHPPWSLQIAEAIVRTNTLAEANGLSFVGAPALLHFAGRQDMIAWMPTPLA
jgi:uncharacterized protein YqjF (DUF2071 family)